MWLDFLKATDSSISDFVVIQYRHCSEYELSTQ